MSAGRSNGRTLVVPAREDVLDRPAVGDVEAWARPVSPAPVQRGVITVRHEYAEAPPVAVPAVEAPRVSKVIPWGLVAVALAILVFACYAAWHTTLEPQLQPVKPSSSVDLVGPSRGDSR